jgi:hypothetical protein
MSSKDKLRALAEEAEATAMERIAIEEVTKARISFGHHAKRPMAKRWTAAAVVTNANGLRARARVDRRNINGIQGSNANVEATAAANKGRSEARR